MNRVYLLFFIFIYSACMDKFIIPSSLENQSTDDFGAGDTTFVQINPIWGSEYGFTKPTEIAIAQDGRLYIVDKEANSIFVLDQDGTQPNGFEALKNLKDNQNLLISPVDVDIDKKMNVYFIDGSERIFVWNQYWNDIGIKKVSTGGTFTHIETGTDTSINYGSSLWFSLLNSNDWIIKELTSTEDQIIIDSLTQPHIFYDGNDEMNQFLDTYYNSSESTFSGLTTTFDSGNYIFVTDNYGGADNQHRIVQINFQRSLLIELMNDEYVWCFRGQFGSTIKGSGTGAGTLNHPVSLDMDYQGNLYYSQEGDFFPVHMIKPNLSGDFATYTSGFQPSSDDIMDSGLFIKAVDVAVDNSRNVYVVDEGESNVHVFNSNGNYFKSLGFIGDSIPVLNTPSAVAVDERGVLYVCNSGDSSIYRFKLSNSLDEDLKSED